MTDATPSDPATGGEVDLEGIEAAYESAKVMPGEIRAAKRIQLVKASNGATDEWWVGYGKCVEQTNSEGLASHWRWLAMILLGLADPEEAPYAEDKPTPEVVPALIARLRAAEARVGELEAERKALLGPFPYQNVRRAIADPIAPVIAVIDEEA